MITSTGINCFSSGSTTKINNLPSFFIYPNPISKNGYALVLKVAKRPQYAFRQCICPWGSTVSMFVVENEFEFNIESPAAGIYLLEIDGFARAPIIKI